METLSTSLVIFLTLVANAFGKIILMLLGVVIAFLTLPQSRAAAMLGIAVLSAFAGGILIQLYQADQNWKDALALSIAFGSGLMVYPFLAFFRKFNVLVNQDDELAEMAFESFKALIKKILNALK